MNILKSVCLFILLFVFSLLTYASEQNSVKFNLKDILSGVEPNKITPNENEEIEPFSGTLKLKYTDFSVPVGPNLNMEVMRSYSSDIYSSEPFPYDRHYQYSLALEGWSFHNGYISDPLTNDCVRNECRPILVTGSGERKLLFEDTDKPGQFRTTDHWVSETIPPGGGLILIAPNGNKHYFQTKFQLHGSDRYYLTKVENVYGDYISYHYDGPFIDRITSSNPGQEIKIDLVSLACKIYGKHHYAYGPSVVKYNGKEVARYTHDYLDIGASQHNYSLTNVKLANGKSWSYTYGFIYLHTKYARENYYKNLLHTVTEPTGITKYHYAADKSLSLSKDVHSVRLYYVTNKNHNGVENGSWYIGFNKGPGDKVITIKNKDFTVVNKYHNYANGVVWKAGLPISSTVYKNNTILPDNVLRKENYEWEPVKHSNAKRGYWVLFPYDLKHVAWRYKVDDASYRPVLTKKIIEQDGDSYTTQYSDHDEFDNPGTITQSTTNKYANGNKTISLEYLNLTDKNILGLPLSTIIDGVQVQGNRYNETGNLIYSNELGRVKSFSYSNGVLQSQADAYGVTTKYNNHKLGIPQEILYADKTSESVQVNSQGLVTSHKDQKGAVTKTTYDVFGRVLEKTPASGSNKIFSYPNANKVIINHDDYNETISTSRHDLPIHKVIGNSKQIFYNYDAYGRKIFESFPVSINDSGNRGNTYTYDSLNRVISICSGDRNATDNCIYYNYLPYNTTRITNSNGEYREISKLSYSNPGSGDVVRIKEFDRVTNIKRDNLGFVQSVSQGDSNKQVVKTYKYDTNYNLEEYIEPESGVTRYQYDKVGNLILKANNDSVTKYIYDPKNYNLIEKKYSDDSYDELFDYDANGNLILSNKGKVSLSYEYDSNNRLIEESLLLDDLATKNNKDEEPLILSARYNYNSKGDLVRIIYPDDTAIDLEPNEHGQPTRLGGYVNNIDYHSNGHWQSFIFKNGINASTNLDDLNRVNNYSYGSFNLNYNYDSNNNLISLGLNDTQNKDYNHNLNFSYDLSGRLSKAEGPWGYTKYNYDSNDNITGISNKLKKQSGFSNQVYHYDNKLHLISVNNSNSKAGASDEYSYDKHGNLTSDNKHRYLYGLDGNLLTVSGSHSSYYEYDTNHNRVLKQENGILNNKQTITFYSKSGNALYDYDIESKKHNKYLYLNGHKVVKVESSDEDKNKPINKISYYYNDSIGSPIAMADSQGKTMWSELYQPFGMQTLNHNQQDNKYGFAGKEVDNTKLSYFGARFYSSKTGRFMAVDPEPIDPDKPFSFNRYAYANNNPYKYVDPDGRMFWMAVGIGITAYDTYTAYQAGGFNSAAKHLVRTGAMTIATGGAFKVASKALPVAKYMYYMRKVEKLDVSTKRNGAVFYSGPGNRQLAEEFATFNNRTTLEMTKGGNWLDKKNLFDKADQANQMTKKQVGDVWERLSERFAEEASGTAVGFAQGARQNGIFNTVESPALFNNSNITNVITGGY